MTPQTLRELHDLCTHNKRLITKSTLCCCFQCETIFTASEIREWCDEGQYEGVTAVCPKCGVDSVIPIDTLIRELHDYWFQPMYTQ